MRDVIQAVRRTLEDGGELVLATIVESSGSTPRRAGAAMAVMADGSIVGTVGGGLMEAMTQRQAKELFAGQAGCAVLARHEMDNELAAKADMVCGGEVTVLLEHLCGGTPCSAPFAVLDEALGQGRRTVMLTGLGKDEGGAVRVVGRGAFNVQEECSSWQGAPARTMERACDDALAVRHPLIVESGETTLVATPYAPEPAVYIFGAGHVSRPTAQMARIAGFRTVVVDDRADFANRDRFPDADEIFVPPSMDLVMPSLGVNEDDSLVIVTRGHLHDKIVLAQALETPARYIGMIGSSRKRDQVYDALRGEGVDDMAIARCHCPIGLSIGARTPEEIAVSIVAELVQCRTLAEVGEADSK